jgi:2-amino-4-hydroxy-6-hydroxymethyldihydropteridine diphosphokinase
MNRVYLSIGSNVDKERNLTAGASLLADYLRLVAASPVYETRPIGNPNDPTFLNAALVIETSLDARTLKETVLHQVEDQLGRRRSPDRNAPRTFDVDISLFNDEMLDLDGRRIPDPDVLRYSHVAAPLADVAPQYRHPETGETLAEIAARLIADGPPLLRRDDVALVQPRA